MIFKILSKKKIIYSIIFIIILIALINTGLKIILIILPAKINNNIKINNISGNIISGYKIKEISYINKDNYIKVKNLIIKPNIKFNKININILCKLKVNKINNLNINIESKTIKGILNFNNNFIIKLSNITGYINQTEVNSSIIILIKKKKIILKKIKITCENNTLYINNKYYKKIKIISPELILKYIKFNLYYIDKKFILQNIIYKNIKIIYIKGKNNYKQFEKINIYNINYKKNHINALLLYLNGTTLNHQINIQSKYIKLNINGIIINKNLIYTIKKIKYYNFNLNNPAILNISNTCIKIKRISFIENKIKYKFFFKLKLDYNKDKKVFGIIYIYTTNLKIPEINIKNNNHYNIFIKSKIYGNIYRPYISTKCTITS